MPIKYTIRNYLNYEKILQFGLGFFFGISYDFLILYHQREIYNVQLLMSIVSQLFRLKF